MKNYSEESKGFVRHEACPKCGSSDAVSVYYNEELDGETKHCFSCNTSLVTDYDLRRGKKGQRSMIDFPEIRATRVVRGISIETQRKYASGFLPNGDYGFPYDLQHSGLKCGGFKGVKKQKVNGKKVMYAEGSVKGTDLYGLHAVADGRKWIVVTEGEFDAMAVYDATGYNAVSLPTGSQSAVKCIKHNLEWLETFERVIICFDADTPGQAAAEAVMEQLTPGKGYLVQLPTGTDANQLLMENNADTLKECIQNAKPKKDDRFITGEDLEDTLFDYKFGMRRKGIHLGFTEIDAKFTLRPGEVTTVMGDTYIGKSTFARQIVANLLQQGYQVGVFSNEETSNYYALRTLATILGCTYDTLTPTIWKENKDLISDVLSRLKVYIGYGFDVESTKKGMEYAYRSYDVDVCVFDNLTGGFAGDTDYKEKMGGFYKMVTGLCKEYNRHAIVVSHIRRDKDIKPGVLPGLHHAYGASQIEQLSHNIISLAKDSNSLIGKCLKQRHTGACFDFELPFNPEKAGYNGISLQHREDDTYGTPPENGSETSQPEGVRQRLREGLPQSSSEIPTDTEPDSPPDVRDNPEEEVQSRLPDTVQTRKHLHRGEGTSGQTDNRDAPRSHPTGKEFLNTFRAGQNKKILETMHKQHRAMGKKEQDNSV